MSIGENFCNAFQVWKPAVKKETENGVSFLVEDKEVCKVRTYALATTVIAATCWLSMINTTIVVSPLISLPVAGLLTIVALKIFDRIKTPLDQDAIQVFTKLEKIPNAVLDRLASSPSAVAKLLDQPGVIDLENPKWAALLDQTLRHSDDPLINENRFQVFKLLVDGLITPDIFLKVTKRYSNIDFIVHMLVNQPAIVKQLTNEQQHECLVNFSRDDEALNYAVMSGCDINAKNSTGETALVTLLKENLDLSKIAFLLKWGIEIPSPDSFDCYGLKKQKIIRLFSETKNLREGGKQPQAAAKPLAVPLLNLLKPAIKDGVKYQVNIQERIEAVAHCAIALYFILLNPVSGILSGISMSVMTYGIVSALPVISYGAYVLYEHSRTAKALNNLAIQTFKNDFFHSAKTSEYIIDHLEILDQLIKEGANLSKLDKDGNTLLDVILKLPDNSKTRRLLFQQLIDQLVLGNLTTEQKYSYLMSIITTLPQPYDYLNDAIQKGLIDANLAGQLTEQQQSDLFRNLNDLDSISLLEKQGFHFNSLRGVN